MVEVTGGSSVSSKGTFKSWPSVYSARGNRLFLEKGACVDWPMGLHGALYGYAPAWWVEALAQAADSGQTATLLRRDEQEVAYMLAGFYPQAEAVRFMCNGGDPCAAAAKIARAVTGRDKLLVYGYHGSYSGYCTPPEVSGIEKRGGCLDAEKESFVPLDWGCYPSEINFDDVAAVVVEVPSEQFPTCWLRDIADNVHRRGGLFILDEVKTAFRYGPDGAVGYYGLENRPDLICFGKTLGNGYPISCLAGRKDIMDELTKTVHYSGTFFAEPIGLAVAKATLRELSRNAPWSYIQSVSSLLINTWNRYFNLPTMYGHPSRPELKELGPALQSKLFQAGHLIMRAPWYVTTTTQVSDVNRLVEAAVVSQA